jgi:hypothetical protein
MIELMVDANDDDEYDHVFFVFDKLIDEDALDAEVIWSIGPELLRRMHSNLDNEKFQERVKKILKDLDKRTQYIFFVIKNFVEAHPEDASVARFGLELIRNESFKFDYENDDVIPFFAGSMICHEEDPIVQVHVIHCLHAVLSSGDMGLVDEVQETDALHACL